MLYIMDAELIEGNYVLYQGDLSTNCVGKAQKPAARGALAGCMAWTWKISENAGHWRPANRAYHIQDSSLA
ncbi:hypothetical protein C4K23_1846 [Pseudomonas chlororaphis]|nr:hypothetical protein C4K23_1846 [Pseudomonas chlororaphis]AZD65786.1 hypothetical protein C4K17_1890 [Pseudomonas chlororaphis subsp. aurantiaca]AZD72265.1 hypothetical protein C4K16_1895 [Pseudomonas chlororaphis subsp. aurantiaca]AZE34952.1 hypothetical protein C4K06_1909 [Pseudomonas chlororaphis subsp. aureofaciens]AZE41286.1 hypothetical protein C4K05_1936 [Pseudomonas chlororaphis subsp. aureofaciens]